MSFLADITSFSKKNLKACETVVRTNCYINEEPAKEKHGLEDEKIEEFWDSPAVLEKKIKDLAELVRNSNYLVTYTGAGVSTSANLPDYRGSNGAWTLSDRGLGAIRTIDLEKIYPTISHMAIRTLIDHKICKMLVSTNVDGLHRRSGLKEDQLSELHGNCYREYCKTCKKEFLRTYDCTKLGCVATHETGRACEECNSPLYDTIIHFNEQLPVDQYSRAQHHSKNADLCIVMGTSMLVSPANQLPLLNPDSKLVIINRQKTPFDQYCSVRIFADTDDVLQLLMKELNIPIVLSVENPTETFTISVPPIKHDQNYQESISRIARKANIIQNNHAEDSNPLAAVSRRKTTNFSDLNNQEKIIDASIAVRNGLIFLEKCSKLHCKVNVNSSKLILLKLSDCTIEVNQPILTSALEVIDCKNVTIQLKFAAETITVDKCEDCHFVLQRVELMRNLYSCQSLNISISPSFSSVTEKVVVRNANEFETNPEAGVPQFISRFASDGTLVTELVVREGVGYATTKREKERADAKQKYLMSKLYEMTRSANQQ